MPKFTFVEFKFDNFQTRRKKITKAAIIEHRMGNYFQTEWVKVYENLVEICSQIRLDKVQTFIELMLVICFQTENVKVINYFSVEFRMANLSQIELIKATNANFVELRKG